MATNSEDVKNKLAQKAQAPAKTGNTLIDLINRQEDQIKRALPKHISPERFTRIALTAVRNTPKLQKCNPLSFIAALMQSAQLGLEPNTPLGQAYLIPYGTEAQFQLGYQGMLTLAYRSGEYKSIYAMEVYENDKFEYAYGLEERLIHVPADKPVGEPVYYYAVYHLKNGGYGFQVMSREQIEKHMKDFSQSANSKISPWKTSFDAMAKKTVLKKLLKYAPKSVEFSNAITADETIKHDISEDMSAADWDLAPDSYEVIEDEASAE